MKIQTFEKWLEEDKWEPEGVLDDDMPDAFDAWLAELDTQEVMDFAEEWGEKRFLDGKELVLKTFEPNIKKLQHSLDNKIIAGVDFSEPLDSLENITGQKLSDMLGKTK